MPRPCPGRAQAVIAVVSKLLKDPLLLERLNKQGIEPAILSNPDFARLLAQDY